VGGKLASWCHIAIGESDIARAGPCAARRVDAAAVSADPTMVAIGRKMRLAAIRAQTIAIVVVAIAGNDFARARSAARHRVISRARNAAITAVHV
jgi:hypothetical protein